MRIDRLDLLAPGIEEAIVAGEEIGIAEPVEPEVVIVAIDRQLGAAG